VGAQPLARRGGATASSFSAFAIRGEALALGAEGGDPAHDGRLLRVYTTDHV
jgi:hypothetical protein